MNMFFYIYAYFYDVKIYEFELTGGIIVLSF